MSWLNSITNSMDMNLSKLLEIVEDRGDWHATVHGTLRSLLYHKNSKASILQCSAFSMVQISYLYMINGKTIALTIWTFIGKVMSLLLNNAV